MKKFAVLILIFLTTLCAKAYEDCIVSTDGKLTDIKIEDNQIIDVCPLITIMNDKNTLIVHPLKSGNTRFCVLKNNKNIIIFNVQVSEDETIIDEVEGFEILPLDNPPEGFDLDLPPIGGNL